MDVWNRGRLCCIIILLSICSSKTVNCQYDLGRRWRCNAYDETITRVLGKIIRRKRPRNALQFVKRQAPLPIAEKTYNYILYTSLYSCHTIYSFLNSLNCDILNIFINKILVYNYFYTNKLKWWGEKYGYHFRSIFHIYKLLLCSLLVGWSCHCISLINVGISNTLHFRWDVWRGLCYPVQRSLLFQKLLKMCVAEYSL